MSIKLKKLLQEKKSWLKDEDDSLSLQEKREFLEWLKKFNEYADSVHRSISLKEVVEDIDKMLEMASKIALEETDDWFDKVSIDRDMKSLNDNKKIFEKTAKEVTKLQYRLESAYQSIGNVLTKYYDL